MRERDGSAAVEQSREVVVQPVIDPMHGGLRRDALEVTAICLGAGDREPRGEQLSPQQAGGIEALQVDVLGVAGERERQARDQRGEPRNGRAAMREVRVQMPDVRGGEQPLGQGDGLKQLLEVHLARPRPARFPRSHRLRERRRGAPG